MIILALEHPPAFIAESVIGSIVANAVCCVFALSYAMLAQRRGWLVSLAAAYLVWLIGVTLGRLVEWNLSSALALSVILFAATIIAGRRFRTDTAKVRVRDDRRRYRLARRRRDALRRRGDDRKPLDRLLRLRRFRVLSRGDGIVLSHFA